MEMLGTLIPTSKKSHRVRGERQWSLNPKSRTECVEKGNGSELSTLASKAFFLHPKTKTQPSNRVCGEGQWHGDAGAACLLLSSFLLSSLELCDTKVYEPLIRALFGIAAHCCKVIALKLSTPNPDQLSRKTARARSDAFLAPSILKPRP